MIDPMPISPAEYVEAQKKRRAEVISELVRKACEVIPEKLKTTSARIFDIDVPGGDHALSPEVGESAKLIKEHFEQAGWEVSIEGNGDCGKRLWFDLPGARASRSKAYKIVGIVAAVIALAVGGVVWHYARGSSGKVAGQSDSALGKLIQAGKFSYVNSDITEENFPDVGVSTDYKVYHFDRWISSEDAIKEVEKEGYKAANLRELVAYSQNGWNGKETVVALGQLWRDSNGSRGVPCLCFRDERELNLRWVGGGWSDGCRFLAVRN